MPELAEAVSRVGSPDFTLELVREFTGFQEQHSFVHEWLFPNGDRWLCVSKAGSTYVLAFPDLATFAILDGGKRVLCRPDPDTPPETLRHLFLDQVVPVLLSAWGKLVLHASGVAGPDGTLGFIGVAGAGKSTMAAGFLADGYSVVTDDCLIVESGDDGFTIRSNYPGLRLWPETAEAVLGDGLTTADVAHYTRKKRVAASQEQPERLPLRRLYLLAESEAGSSEISIETVPPAEAFIELIKYTFRLDVTDRKRLVEEFGPFSRLVNSGYVKRLRYPREISLLPQVRKLVLADAASAEKLTPASV